METRTNIQTHENTRLEQENTYFVQSFKHQNKKNKTAKPSKKNTPINTTEQRPKDIPIHNICNDNVTTMIEQVKSRTKNHNY